MIGALSAGITGATAVFSLAANLLATAQKAKAGVDYVKDKYQTIDGQRSLTDVMKLSRVEPEVIVDNDCANWEYLPETMQTLHSIFTGYYLQAATIFGSVDAVKVMGNLAKLNPTKMAPDILAISRESYQEALRVPDGSWKYTTEAYKWSLPFDTKQMRPGYSLEAVANKNTKPQRFDGDDEKDRKNKTIELLNNDAIKTMADPGNLAVGKMVNVTMCDASNGNKLTFPVSIRFLVSYAQSDVVRNILSQYNFDNTFKERFFAWREGRINFIKDLIICQDMIDEKKRNIIKDKSGVYHRLTTKMTDHGIGGLSDGNPSMAAASTIVVASTNTIEDLEYKLGGKIDSVRIRNKVFESGYMMILAVVDKQYDMVTFYHRGVATPTTMSVRDMKISNKGGGPDILDILKALGQGNAPQL